MTGAPIALPELDRVGAEPADAEHDQRLARLQPRDSLEPVERRRDRVGEHRQHRGRDRGAAGG